MSKNGSDGHVLLQQARARLAQEEPPQQLRREVEKDFLPWGWLTFYSFLAAGVAFAFSLGAAV